jgi:signal transduction histidine kinase/CheY-like chemotaxis protein
VTEIHDTVLVLAPRGRDGELMQQLLASASIEAEVATVDRVVAAVSGNAGAVVITQEALDSTFRERFASALPTQPPWSDLPIIVLVNTPTTDVLVALTRELGNLTVLERPVAPLTLLAAVRSALRTRARQHAARVAIEQRDQFLAMLGHELRNPLAAIVLAAKLARDGGDRYQLDQRLEVIERQSNVLARLVDDLLDVARVTTGKVRLRREPVDIDAAIRSCISALDDKARRRTITVVFTSGSGTVIEGDTVRIEQVLSNLLSNAIKYSPAGRTVRIESARVRDTCEIRVRDQGIGIALDMQPHVFDLFAQVDGSIDRAEGGMGIGLTLVERLVRLHSGSIELVSAGLGQGSEFIIRLPVGNPPVDDKVLDISPRRDANKVRVVLVEDNADLRELTQEMLEALGCSVEVAVDGLEGVERILSSSPDVAIVDIGLPGLDGFGVARKVREQLGPSQLLVAVTGYGRDQDREEAHRAGFDLHMTKPMSVDALRDLLVTARRNARTA